ncbi:hypothetical protein FNV43_RR25975 [Rhamnella rubrinervis]|uniref:Pentatricopeptide repeat-containing protein n=1 Tax=Rhamnella rubrinervis TaxID=2594499 RepID=A0A8K0GR18_9ROSA|nr:hypothetical protein FNV43_RR25975 [Rhamnella rubrinervis]
MASFASKSDIPIAPLTSSLSLHLYRQGNGHEDVYSKNRTIDDLIKVGNLNSAVNLFNEMPLCDNVTYNLLISGHRRSGLQEHALLLYTEMVSLGIRESASTFSSVLGVCSDAGFYREGVQVHCRAFCLGFGSNLFVGSSLISLYLCMGLDNIALKLFDELPEQSLGTWNVIFRRLCDVGRVDELLRFYYSMKMNRLEPNGLTFCYLIRGCCGGRFLEEGKQVHCHAVKSGWVESNIFVANALVDFYSACGSLIDARKAFEAIPPNDVISWNSMVWIYAGNGLWLEAIGLFAEMQFWGKRPSIRSFVGLLNLASGTKNIEFGKQIHSCAVKLGFDHGSVHVQSALINLYGKCNDIQRAVAMYESVKDRSLECCNSLMSSLLHCDAIEDVVEMFGLMVDEGIGLDEVALSMTLKALSMSALASLASVKLLHSVAIKLGFESDVAVLCSLIDAYSRCGNIEHSHKIFEEIPSPSVICFTSIINGYAQNGMGSEGLDLFQAMIQKGLKPDKVTFLCVLSACSHSGLVKEGKLLFDSMKTSYGISPDRQHYSCMVDLLGRAGLLDEAEKLLHQAPVRGDLMMWSSLLRSCTVHNNEILGRKAAKILLELDPKNPAICLQTSNFYSEIGEFETSMQIRELAMARKVTREIGHSLIEINNPR